MDIKQLSTKYHVRRLTEGDIEEILLLFAGNPLFFQHCPPVATRETVLADMKALPPGMTYADKYYLGIFDDGRLIAVMDLILNYPNGETAFIGFFMVAAQMQGRGVGTFLVTDIVHCLLSWGYRYTRLGYVKGNPQSKAFWHKNRFRETGVETNTEDYTIVVTQRENV